MPVKDITFPSIADAKKNFSVVWDKAFAEHAHYRIVVGMETVATFSPEEEDLTFTEEHRKAYEQAKKELERGEVYSYDQIMEKYA